MTTYSDWVKQVSPEIVSELLEYVSIRSISTAAKRDSVEIDRAVKWLMRRMAQIGLQDVERMETGGNPLVYAEWHQLPDAPTILCYGHYDVQDASDDQFVGRIVDGNLVARGANDNKGQQYTHLKAAEILLRHEGRLPCNLKFIVDGGEEDPAQGDLSIQFIRRNAGLFAADCALISDTDMFAPNLPTIITGLRGIVSLEMDIWGCGATSQCRGDISYGDGIHSGIHGGAAPNAVEAAAHIIANCKAADGRVLIPGFYDDMRSPCPAEIDSWRRLPFSEQEYLERQLQGVSLAGENAYPVLQRIFARPTFEVHGVIGGNMNPHADRTIIPSRCLLKVSMRIVSNQLPAKVFEQLRIHVERVKPHWVDVEIRMLPGSPAVLVEPDNLFVEKAAKALAATFRKDPVFVRDGASIPIVDLFVNEMQIPCVVMGWGLPDDGPHTAHEKVSLDNLYSGVEAVMRFLGDCGNTRPQHGMV